MEISTATHFGVIVDLSRFPDNQRAQARLSSKKIDQTAFVQSSKDTVTLSREGLNNAAGSTSTENNADKAVGLEDAPHFEAQEVLQLQELKMRDAEVRAHEQAHLSVAGQYARGSASFSYQKGPDGFSYAVGGEVRIDMGVEKTPEATMNKMRIIKRAALAPASPSAADRSIAAQASILESQARQEVLAQRQEELLHAQSATNPTAGDTTPVDDKQKTKKIPQTPAYNTLRTMIAAYQRTTDYSGDGK